MSWTNVIPTELDAYKPERWVDDALFRPEVRHAFHRLMAQGWTDALRALHPDERIYTFWDYLRNACAPSSWAKSRRSTRHARPGAVAVATTFCQPNKMNQSKLINVDNASSAADQ